MIESANAKSAVLTSVDIIETGDGIVEIGRAVLTVEPEANTTAEMKAKYVVYWQLEDDRWKWSVDIWNQNA